jgi:hypothetical protein
MNLEMLKWQTNIGLDLKGLLENLMNPELSFRLCAEYALNHSFFQLSTMTKEIKRHFPRSDREVIFYWNHNRKEPFPT